jgi:hypothetical protein
MTILGPDMKNGMEIMKESLGKDNFQKFITNLRAQKKVTEFVKFEATLRNSTYNDGVAYLLLGVMDYEDTPEGADYWDSVEDQLFYQEGEE